ncbi:MAG: 4-hydroxy-tetrahydrodipicolinate synthase [Bacteroidetes bacterium HGW-Bacteroidetes-12]|nr:MAG: 4-hydroxy-tetrahydrodipicolinate synthase [Bacteroidetes bacterium HGW-Bacteroidetes-12]
MTMKNFRGTGVAIVTPFKSDKSIDYNALKKLVEHLIANKIDYLVVQGTTGESVTLTKEEKAETLAFIIKINNNRLPIVLGLGGNCTQTIIDSLKSINLTGVDAILSVSPYYNKPTQEGIYQHYKAIATATTKPIILYNVPGRTSSNILPVTTLRLANDFKNIIGIKEASGNLEQCMEIIKNKPARFLVISGDDALTLPFIASGGDGVISVLANAFPKGFSSMVNAALSGNIKEAQDLHYKHFDIIHYLFCEGNPAGIKATLKVLGITGDTVRLPLVNVSDTTYNKIKELTSEMGSIIN